MATSAKNWQRSGTELELPSGNTALVKRVGPEALLRKGVLPDALRGTVLQMVQSGQGMRPEQARELAKDSESVLQMIDAMDRVLCTVVMEPHVLYHKGVSTDRVDPRTGLPVYEFPSGGNDENVVEIPAEDRNEDALYADDVDFEDKSFIFNYTIGGTKDIARFRRESELSLGDAQDGKGVLDDAEQPPGD